MNIKKLVLPTVMATLLVSIPVTSNAYTRYSNTNNSTRTAYSNTVTIRYNNGSYSVIKDSSQSKYNYYFIQKDDYFKPEYDNNESVETPENDETTEDNNESTENVQPKPEPKPEPQPEPTPEPAPQPQPTPEPEPTPEEDQNVDNEQPTSNANHSLSAAEIKMVELVNKERQAAGLQALQIDVDLAYVARVKSQDMNDNNYFSHQSPTYGSPFEMMKEFGIKYRGAAENIAKNHSVEAAHNSLMRSSGHKANIMNSNYTHIGIGIVNGYYTQMFISK